MRTTHIPALLTAALALTLPTLAATPTAKSPASEFRIEKQWNLGGPGGWGLPAFDPASHQLFIPRNNRVMVIDTETGALVAEIGGMKNLREIALDDTGRYAFVTDPTDGSAGFVRVIDRISHTLTASVPTGRVPAGIAFDPATKSVLALNSHDHTITVIHVAASPDPAQPTSTNVAAKADQTQPTGTNVAAKADQAQPSGANQPTATIPLPGRPAAAIADGAGSVFVTLPVQALILRIDVAAKKIAATFPLTPCTGPSGLAIDAAHHQLFTTCEDHKLVVLDTSTGHITPIADAPPGSGELSYSPLHGLLFLSSGTGTLTIFHHTATSTFTTLQTVKTQPGTRALAVNYKKDQAFLATSKFSMNTNTPSEELQFRPTPVPGTFSVIVVAR